MARALLDTRYRYVSVRHILDNVAKALLLLSASLALLPWFALSTRAAVGGSISGTVTDATGGAVSKADVTATNSDTGIRQTVVTDDKGFYSFPSLPVGRYDLEVATGFL